MKPEEISALNKAIDLVEDFSKKNVIPKKKININRIREKFNGIKNLSNEDNQFKQYKSIIKKLSSFISSEIPINIYFIIGGHGGIIINSIGFCEFDSPEYAMDTLIKKMKLAIETNMPYSLEIATSCLEWLKKQLPDKSSYFFNFFHQGKFEIINPSYSQPYNLIIGPESNIKQFEYGLKELRELGLECNMYYCSESSLHPQIPQILKGFNISYCSLRSRLLGINPTSISPYIDWIGLDNTSIDAIVDQSGIFNGEYWHGMFFKEIPSLLFQSLGRPFMENIIYSNIEDFCNHQPFQEEIWRISKISEIFGKFIQCSEFFQTIPKNGEFKYKRDEFFLGNFVFIPSELFLQNKNSEILLLSAEVFNCILGFFGYSINDSLFEDLWKKFLLTQAHDCYAVPFVRSGDYTQTQLGKDELEKLDITFSDITISDLSLQLHKEIQERCQKFINDSFSNLVNEFNQKENDSKNKCKSIIVFNPTPYNRRDIISVHSKQDSCLQFIEEVPQFGFKIVPYTIEDSLEPYGESNFLFKVEILDDLKTILITYKRNKVFLLRFHTKQDYELYLEEQSQNDVLERKIIIDRSINHSFKVGLVHYSEINRLEFSIDSDSLQEIIITPLIEIKKSIINYPFGIEETRRFNIQTLDFMWLKGSRQGILYIQKNCQKFIINRENFEIRNLLTKRGRYEFAISITDENDSVSPLFYVNSYYYKFLSIIIDKNLRYTNNFNNFLTIEPPISVINLWRRENDYFLRLFNPSNEERTIRITGKLIKNQIKEIDFNYNVISSLDTNNVKIGSWKIKTLKF
ncbi:MAG: hypothetical protein ACFFCV_08115 [Promethearchaeota archaeon]